MNKITKRIVASLSAAALIVSTFGSNSFSGTMMDSVYAEESATTSNRKGKSTGFENLEQDTNADGEYNTGYGLHTNKTASVADGSTDGRTFDVNLESWYVGENPVDIATILDASGSMAWTVDTLEPLVIDEKAVGMNKDELRELQEKNGGYLPEAVVEKILKSENSDSTKLSYSGYRYYVYEDRSSVSEFVPLGFWDGGIADNLIGYYNFDNNLTNQITGDSASYIKNVNSGEEFSKDSMAQIVPQPIFVDEYLDLSETDKNGNLVVNLSELALDSDKAINISFKLKCANVDKKCAPQAPILYLGDGTNQNYIALMRGRSHDEGSGASNHIYVFEGKGSEATGDQLDTYLPDGTRLPKSSSDSTPTNDNNVLKGQTGAVDKDNGNVLNCSWKIVKKDEVYDITLTVGSSTYVYHTDSDFSIDTNKLYLVIGGNDILPYGNLENKGATVIDKDDLKGIKIKDLTLSGTSIDTDTSVTFTLPLTNSSGLTDSSNSISAEYNKQSTDGKNILAGPQDSINAEVSYKDNALNLAQTAKNGAVLLDAAQQKLTGNDFTISFKIKQDGTDNKPTAEANLFYLGSLNTSGGYNRIFRAKEGSSNRLKMDDSVSINSIFGKSGEYKTITITIKGTEVKHYIDGEIYEEKNKDTGEITSPKNLSSVIDLSDISLIIGGLWDNGYNGADILIDDLYVFDRALSTDEVAACFGSAATEICESSTEKTKKSHAIQNVVDKSTGTTNKVSLAQITSGLANNEAFYRRGWYYVNSHSDWIDISGEDGDTLESGKQYVGIAKDAGIEKYCNIDEATIPSAWKDSVEEPESYAYQIKQGDKGQPKYVAPAVEQSIRFYVDAVGYLRCFVYSGGESKEGNPKRTFCSVVYWKGEDSNTKSLKQTKYERLNDALNQFYSGLAEYSDLTNTAVVRYSTMHAADSLDQLIMQEWTSWSDYYQEEKEKNPEANPNNTDYLKDLLIPKDWETSITQQPAAEKKEEQETVGKTGQYPYVMTGGTYTWTGLKSFYDNMVDIEGKKSGNRVYDVATDARDKYLIIFTDGRDNTQDIILNEDGTGVKEYGSDYKDTDYVTSNNPYSDDTTHTVGDDNHKIQYDGDLAEAWADKLKEEGYTIYCVMMSTGSVSKTANAEEYSKAYYFLNTLAGSKEIEDEIADLEDQLKTETDPKALASLNSRIAELKKDVQDHVIVAEPTDGSNTVAQAFQTILEQIQKPRTDYTVQDYIDPRFNLIGLGDDGSTITYNLGANGTITYNGITKTVGNDIGNSHAEGLAYTPIKSEMVNRKENPDYSDGYDNGDNKGTGYIYYDDEKDMYYLRWTNQVIPMRDSSFNTDTNAETPDYLDVWSATIRLKAKDDFIGGNDILTNGNEAGENLVFSTSTIDNMETNYKFYGFTDEDKSNGKVTEREKLQKLSGTDRKINAVDADGVSQAVYGDGMDIPSSGFPRVTVNVRLLKLNANNMNDVIYMGEVVSPTMMLADLENDYMTGSYYLQYLERYAYRLYGKDADQKPLIELLNQWLKINVKDEAEKTFTIPYIYLPDPEYDDAGNLVIVGDKVKIENSTGLDSIVAGTEDAFNDLNLRDVTGFITYTWRRDDGSKEEQQKMEEKSPSGEDQYDITKEYVVKNTDQIKYNLQLKFTPLLKENLEGFTLDTNFIKADASGKGEQFFNVKEFEFNSTGVTGWTFTNRSEYLKAMVSETHIYEPHIMYDSNKWVLVNPEDSGGHSINDAIDAYIKDDQTEKSGEKQVEDKGVYDWDSIYKNVAGEEQIEVGKYAEYYTDTPDNVKISDDKHSLEANTTYIKDVVNGALALELVVDGKYLQGSSQQIKDGKTYTFIATRYYDDPYDPLPYGESGIGHGISMNADTGETGIDGKVEGKDYQLTFKINKDTLPKEPKDGEFYTVWADIEKVEVEVGTSGYVSIDSSSIEETPYVGYTDVDSLPIGTYVIKVDDEKMKSEDVDNQYYIGNVDEGNAYFKFVKIDNTSTSYTYDRFPESVNSVSETAKDNTKDSEYLIWDDTTDNASKNIAENNRVKDTTTQTLTFYFGTVESREINGKTLSNTKGYSRTDILSEGNDYAKDRLGIILLSANPNSLFISKEVTHTNSETEKYKDKFWTFTITFMPNTDAENMSDFNSSNTGLGFSLTWSRRDDSSGTWNNVAVSELGSDYPIGSGSTGSYPTTIKFTEITDKLGTYTATIKLKHNEKVLISNLPSGIWQVTETDERSVGDKILYSAHNDMDKIDEYSWSNKTDEQASLPGAGVQFTNQFPFYILSAGGSGTYLYILCGGLLLFMASVLYYLSRLRKSKSRDKPDG